MASINTSGRSSYETKIRCSKPIFVISVPFLSYNIVASLRYNRSVLNDGADITIYPQNANIANITAIPVSINRPKKKLSIFLALFFLFLFFIGSTYSFVLVLPHLGQEVNFALNFVPHSRHSFLPLTFSFFSLGSLGSFTFLIFFSLGSFLGFSSSPSTTIGLFFLNGLVNFNFFLGGLLSS